ncbi:MAG: Rid family detoxifying hydrolase [Deltaproteobacteria bacterium]
MNEVIIADKAPRAVGPYSQAVRASVSEMLFCSGQLPLDPATNAISDGSPAGQAEQAMKNLEAVVRAGGFAMSDVVKTTIYLTDLACFAEINTVYESFFQGCFPARCTVQVSALPKGALVEIDAIASR